MFRSTGFKSRAAPGTVPAVWWEKGRQGMNRKERRAANKQTNGAAPAFGPPTAHLVDIAYRQHQSANGESRAQLSEHSRVRTQQHRGAATSWRAVTSDGRPGAGSISSSRAIKQNAQFRNCTTISPPRSKR